MSVPRKHGILALIDNCILVLHGPTKCFQRVGYVMPIIHNMCVSFINPHVFAM